jgi:hypothetical protein
MEIVQWTAEFRTLRLYHNFRVERRILAIPIGH